MNLKENTVLITGGTSGIGLALAEQLILLGNTVIVTGRNPDKLAQAKLRVSGVHAIESDVSNPSHIASLYEQVTRSFPTLNMLVNNAGVMRRIDLNSFGTNLEDVTREVEINLNGTIRMTLQFLPHLKHQANSAIINVSSGLAFVPFPVSPVYSATKAAIHSFTQSLRVQMKGTNVKVFELAPPGTDTDLFSNIFRDGEKSSIRPLPVQVLVRQTISGIEKDHYEIRPGVSNALKLMSRIAPDFMLRQLSK